MSYETQPHNSTTVMVRKPYNELEILWRSEISYQHQGEPTEIKKREIKRFEIGILVLLVLYCWLQQFFQ